MIGGVFDFLGADPLKEGIYKEFDMSEVGNAVDVNFTVRKAGAYEINFIYAQDPQKQKEEKNRSEAAFPGYDDEGFTKWFCEQTTAAKLAGRYAYAQGVPVPIGTSEEEKAACTGAKILLKVTLKSLRGREIISYVKGDEAGVEKQNLGAVTEVLDLSKYGATAWYSAPNGSRAHDKFLLRAQLEKGKYSVKIEALNDTPELKNIVTFIKIRRYYYWK